MTRVPLVRLDLGEAEVEAVLGAVSELGNR